MIPVEPVRSIPAKELISKNQVSRLLWHNILKSNYGMMITVDKEDVFVIFLLVTANNSFGFAVIFHFIIEEPHKLQSSVKPSHKSPMKYVILKSKQSPLTQWAPYFSTMTVKSCSTNFSCKIVLGNRNSGSRKSELSIKARLRARNGEQYKQTSKREKSAINALQPSPSDESKSSCEKKTAERARLLVRTETNKD